MPKQDAEIHARIPVDLREKIGTYAQKRDVSSSTVVRWALEDFFGSYPPIAAEEDGPSGTASWITSFLGEPSRPEQEVK